MKNDPSLTAVGLAGLPSLNDLVLQIGSKTWRVLKPLMERMPLLNLLNEILNLAAKTEGTQRRALLDIARLAIAKHQYSGRLYSEIAEALTSASTETDPFLPNLPKEDAKLAMEMLSLMAELFALNDLHEQGVETFRLAELLADRFKLIGDKGVIFHQLGCYELQHLEFAKAEAALRKAAQIFAQVAPDLERRSNYQRALVYTLRLETETDPPKPDDIDTIMARDHKARELVLTTLAKKAVDKNDLANAESMLSQLREQDFKGETISAERLLTEARLARHNGEFEKAELLLKQALRAAGSQTYSEITWESFYLARDLGDIEESKAILERLQGESESIRVDYQRAILAHNSGDNETAERLLRGCLQQTDKDSVRADCMGMLALVSQDGAEGHRFLHEAIGLYVKLDRKLDHAISLSHLAAVEFGEALRKKEAGLPNVAISEFRRSDNLLRHAEEIAESLGALSFVLDLITTRAHLEVARERHNVALRYFTKAATTLELTYLTLTDRDAASLFLSRYTAFYDLAISCALSAKKVDAALLFSERSKARRFLRDAGEISYHDSDGSSHSLSARERELLSKIRPIRSRLIQQRSLALQERQLLYDAEQELRTLWREMRHSPELSTTLARRVHQPLETEILRQIVFNEKPEDHTEEVPENDEPVEELPGGGVMQCGRCFVFNRITSTFCSACDTLLPKSAMINMNVWSGAASEEELKQAFADELYNQGAKLFQKGKIAQAEPLFQKAMSYATHPDYSFFYALCRLSADDSAGALRSLDEMCAQQYAFKYPFWPVPVSADDFHRCVDKLKNSQQSAPETLICLMNAYADYSQKRRAEARKKVPKDH